MRCLPVILLYLLPPQKIFIVIRCDPLVEETNVLNFWRIFPVLRDIWSSQVKKFPLWWLVRTTVIDSHFWPSFVTYSRCMRMGLRQVQGTGLGLMDQKFQSKNIHIDVRQGEEPEPTVSCCTGPVPPLQVLDLFPCNMKTPFVWFSSKLLDGTRRAGLTLCLYWSLFAQLNFTFNFNFKKRLSMSIFLLLHLIDCSRYLLYLL